MPRERVHHGKRLIGPSVEMEQLQRQEDQPMSEQDFQRVQAAHARSGIEFQPGMTLTDDEKIHEQPSLDVAWDRESEYVALGIDAPCSWWDRAVNDYLQHMQGKDDQDRDVLTWSVWTNGLSRQDINYLIRILRRARGAAFGVDE